MRVLFSLKLWSETFLILRRSERGIITNVHRTSCKVIRFSCQILITLEFSRQTFEEASNIKSQNNPSRRSRVVPCDWRDKQTDWHVEGKTRFSQFFEPA